MMTHSGWLLVCSSEGRQAQAAWLESTKKLAWKGTSEQVSFPGTQLTSTSCPALEMTESPQGWEHGDKLLYFSVSECFPVSGFQGKSSIATAAG